MNSIHVRGLKPSGCEGINSVDSLLVKKACFVNIRMTYEVHYNGLILFPQIEEYRRNLMLDTSSYQPQYSCSIWSRNFQLRTKSMYVIESVSRAGT